MSAGGFGMIVGLIVGLMLAVIVYKACNKDKKVKTEYDERQQAIRGKGYMYSYYTLIAYLVLWMTLSIGGIKLPLVDAVIAFIGILLGLMVLGIYTIYNGAYWGINNDPKKYGIVFTVATVINIIYTVFAIKAGTMIEDGTLQIPFVNLLCAVVMVILLIAVVIKKAMSKEEE